MENTLAFARHFAHLVWLLLNDRDGHEAQLAALQALVAAGRDGPVTLAARDWRLLANGLPVPEHYIGAQDLTAQLIGHSVVEVMAERNAAPVDLLLVARVLASEPVPGDGGRHLVERLQAVEAESVHVQVEVPEAAAPPPLPARSEGADAIAAPPPAPAEPRSAPVTGDGRETGDDPHGDPIVREQDPEQMFHAFSTAATPKGSMVKLFQHLDAARSPAAIARQLDALVKLAAESSRHRRLDMVAEIVHGIVDRESRTADRMLQRHFGLVIRRLSTPSILRCIVELLPRRRESHEQYMAILARVGEPGAEALVDALIAAPSIADRRVYYDALLHLQAGVRALLHMLGDPRWYVVRNAVELLGELRVAEADAELTRLLEHRDDRVRAAAASALAKLGSAAAAKGVRGILRGAPAEVRERATAALVLNQSGSVESLIRAFDREEDPRVQMAIVTALGQIGTREATEKLVEIARTERGRLFKPRPAQIRVAAVHALGQVKSPGTLAALQSLLRDKEKAVRGAASWVLMGRKRAAPPPPAPTGW